MPPIAALKRCATQELDPQHATQKRLIRCEMQQAASYTSSTSHHRNCAASKIARLFWVSSSTFHLSQLHQSSFFQLHQLDELATFMFLDRAKNAVRVVERVVNKDAFGEESVLQRRRNRMHRCSAAFAHAFSSAVAVR